MRIEDRDQHTVHRLEAFSDIVIGFCLAQAAVNLALPKNAADVGTVWLNANFLLVSFGIIALLWWFHHRTFSALFVLTPLTVSVNFAILGSLVLSLYFLQIFIHAVASGENVLIFFRLWVSSYLLVYALMAALMLISLISRHGNVPGPDMRWAVGRITVISLTVLFSLWGTFSGFFIHAKNVAYAALLFGVTMVLIGRVIVPLLLRRLLPDG
jgi:uncharacterized membrane protein